VRRSYALGHDPIVEGELLSRSEVTSILFATLDISKNIERITAILEEEFGGEDPEANT